MTEAVISNTSMPMTAKKGHYTEDLVTFTEEVLNGKLHFFV